MQRQSFLLRNGILYDKGGPVIGLGVSYYPSYHPQKVPVPADGPRLREMRRDLEDIKQAGFNVVRCAALGDVRLERGEVRVAFPFVDAMLTEAERLELAFMVRLHGYDMILGGYKDGIMVNAQGEDMPFHWSWFVRNCINHPQVIADNRAGTIASAKHFASFPAVVAYQIYNEPAYPSRGFYCYNRHTVAAYRRWLQEKYAGGNGGDFDAVEPPRRRPGASGDLQAWVDWRVFNTERLSGFLRQVGGFAKEGDPSREVFTCLMPVPLTKGAAIRGEDYHAVAAGMDFLGLTLYGLTHPERSVRQRFVLDAVESAAAASGKAAWLIELDAAVELPGDDYERQTYAVLSRCFKGVIYYQWRADYPFPDSPEPEKYGIIRADRTPTAKFETVVKMNKLVRRLAPYLTRAKKARCGVGMLYSMHAMAYYDGLDRIEAPLGAMTSWYRRLNHDQIVVDLVQSEHLLRNALHVRLLLVPYAAGLSPTEVQHVVDFVARGGLVGVGGDGGRPLIERLPRAARRRVVQLSPNPSAQEVGSLLQAAGAAPAVQAGLPAGHDCEARLLHGDDYLVVGLCNFSRQPLSGAALEFDAPWAPSRVQYFDTECGGEPLPSSYAGGRVRIPLPTLRTGGFIVVHR